MYSLKYIFFCTRNVQLSTHWNIKINVNVRMFGGLSLHSDVTTSGEWKYQYSSQPIQSTFHTFHFYLATRIHSVDYAVARCLSVRLFVCHTPVLCLLDKHAPVITKLSSRKSESDPWFTSTLRAFKSTVRRAENIWKRTHSALYWSSFKSLRNRYHNLILASKSSITPT